jgi:hypothetical protein
MVILWMRHTPTYCPARGRNHEVERETCSTFLIRVAKWPGLFTSGGNTVIHPTLGALDCRHDKLQLDLIGSIRAMSGTMLAVREL